MQASLTTMAHYPWESQQLLEVIGQATPPRLPSRCHVELKAAALLEAKQLATNAYYGT